MDVVILSVLIVLSIFATGMGAAICSMIFTGAVPHNSLLGRSAFLLLVIGIILLIITNNFISNYDFYPQKSRFYLLTLARFSW